MCIKYLTIIKCKNTKNINEICHMNIELQQVNIKLHVFNN